MLDQLGGYILEERGVVAMKGKRDQVLVRIREICLKLRFFIVAYDILLVFFKQVTYWLRGEEPKAAAARAKRRAQREDNSQPPPTEKRGQRSSLKSRNWKNQLGGLHRYMMVVMFQRLY